MNDFSEHNGSPSPGDGDEIFLSPRVVDEKAFSSFAERLRTLIEEARSVSESTRESGESAAKLRTSLANASRELAARLSSSEKLLAEIDRRRQAAEQMYDRAASRAASIAELEEAAERIAQEKKSTLEKSIEASINAADQRVRQIDLRLEQLSKQAQRRADELTARLDKAVADAEARLESVGERLGDAIDGSAVDEKTERLAETCARAESLLTEGEASSTDESLSALLARAERAATDLRETASGAEASAQRIASTNESLEATLERCDAAGADSQARADRLESLLAHIESRTDEIDTRLTERIAEAGNAAKEPMDRLRETARQVADDAEQVAVEARAAREQVDESSDWNNALLMRIEQAAARLEPWRDVLLGDETPDELPRPLAEIIARAHRELSRPLMELGSIIQTIGQRAEMEGGAKRHAVVVADKTSKPARSR